MSTSNVTERNEREQYYQEQIRARQEEIKKIQDEVNKPNANLSDVYRKQQSDRITQLREEINNLQAKSNNLADPSSGGGLKDMLTNVADGVSSTINTTANLGLSVVNNLASGVNTAVSAAAAAVNLGLSAINDLASSAMNVVAGVFSGDSDKEATNAKLASASKDKGPLETKDKIDKVSSSENNGDKSPSFSANGGSGVGPTKNVPQETNDTPMTGQLAKTAEKLKDKDGTNGSLQSTIKSLSEDLKENISTAKATIGETVSNVTSTVGGVVDGVMSQTREMTASFASAVQPVAGAINDVLVAGSDIANSVADALPDSIGKYVKAKYNSTLMSASNKILGSKAATVAKLAGLLPGVTDTSNLWTIVGGLATNTQDKLYDEKGNLISSKVGNNSTYDISTMFSAASQLCSGIQTPTVVSGNEQNLTFDALMALAANKGMSDLVAQLANCGISCGDGQPSKFTSTTVAVLQTCLDAAAKRGDVNTSGAVVEAMGGQNVPDSKKTTTVLMGNMSKETFNDPAAKQALDKMMKECNLTKEDIVSTTTPVGPAIDAQSACLAGATCGSVATGMPDDDYRAALQALSYYSGRY